VVGVATFLAGGASPVATPPRQRGVDAGGGVAQDLEFQGFFASQYEPLCRLGYWLTGDWGEAEELAQEALVRTYWRWPVVRRLDRPDLYARKVLVNYFRSLLRRALVEARHAGRIRQRDAVQPGDHDGSLVLWAAIGRLTPRQRLVLVLRYQQDLSEAEVARLLGLSVGTVKSTASRAVARLRANLADQKEQR
jgi:RNA polymerase sigma-70 factor (sigma-E family)